MTEIEKIYGVPFGQLKPPAGYRFRMVDGEPVLSEGEHGMFLLGRNGKGVFIAQYPLQEAPRLILECAEGTDGNI